MKNFGLDNIFLAGGVALWLAAFVVLGAAWLVAGVTAPSGSGMFGLLLGAGAMLYVVGRLLRTARR